MSASWVLTWAWIFFLGGWEKLTNIHGESATWLDRVRDWRHSPANQLALSLWIFMRFPPPCKEKICGLDHYTKCTACIVTLMVRRYLAVTGTSVPSKRLHSMGHNDCKKVYLLPRQCRHSQLFEEEFEFLSSGLLCFISFLFFYFLLMMWTKAIFLFTIVQRKKVSSCFVLQFDN